MDAANDTKLALHVAGFSFLDDAPPLKDLLWKRFAAAEEVLRRLRGQESRHGVTKFALRATMEELCHLFDYFSQCVEKNRSGFIQLKAAFVAFCLDAASITRAQVRVRESTSRTLKSVKKTWASKARLRRQIDELPVCLECQQGHACHKMATWRRRTNAELGQLTKADLLFEHFCDLHEIKWRRVPTEKDGRTPDYDVYFGGQQVVVEVKLIDATPEESDEAQKLEQGRPALFGGTVGQRVRQKITDSKKQIKNRTRGELPSLLVLYNNTPVPNYTSPEQIKAAMYGFDTIHLEVLRNRSEKPFIGDRKFGRAARMTSRHGTSLSAVAVLRESVRSALSLDVYHNVYAKKQFEPDLLRFDSVCHFTLTPKVEGGFQEWREL